MQQASPSDRTRRRASVSWAQAQEDLQESKQRIKEAPDASCLLSMQCAINALSSIPEAQGRFQLPTYSSVEMLDVCLQYAPELEALRNSCYVLDGLLERDVMGNAQQKNIRFTSAYARTCHQAAEAVLDGLRGFFKANATAYFAP